jgi:predicted transcriptional regulator of viral defense system
MAVKQKERILNIIKQLGTIRYRDLADHHIHPESLNRLFKSGIIIRVGRGLYTLSDIAPQSGYIYFAEISKKNPNGVICLISALAFHEMTTQTPHEVWVAIEEKAWQPKKDRIQIRFVRFSKKLLMEGVDKHIIQNVPVKITNPARTVADCFKYRNKIGLNVALEALKEGFQEHRFTMDELWQYAKLCRVANVMRPYLESVA